MRTLLKNGRILDPSQNIDMVGDLLIEDHQIEAYGPNLDVADVKETYDCTDMWIVPGLIDLHTHLRQPGFDHRETISTGTQAAAAGGYTVVCCMPTTQPTLDSPSLVDYILDAAASPSSGGAFVQPIGALTVGMKGEQLSDLSALRRAGIVAASDVGAPTQNSRVMKRAMEYCTQLDLPIIAHCEDLELSQGGSINEGPVSAMLGLRGIPRSAEEIMVMRNCLLSLHTGCKLHVTGVSTWGAVEMVRQAKYLGAPVSCDIFPHHFCLTEEDVGEFDTRFKVSPPLRTQVDLDIIVQALNDGTIDCIASNHSPYASHEVDVPFGEAPFGISGLESALGVTLTHLTHKGILSPLETVRKLSTAPAMVLRLEGGTMRHGETPVAQITVVDPNHRWRFDVGRTFTKGKNSAFHCMELQGKAVVTFCGAEIYRDAAFPESRVTTSRKRS